MISDETAKELIDNKASINRLGYSESVKGCYWTVYQYGNRYFIGLEDYPPGSSWHEETEGSFEGYVDIPRPLKSISTWG